MRLVKSLVRAVLMRATRAGFGGPQPVSRTFGFDRGMPVDRYYIEKFLQEQTASIRGTVVEIAEDTYTKKFGSQVEKSLVLHSVDSHGADLAGNLETGAGLLEGIADCFIMTQTLPFIFDVHAAMKNSVSMLRPGGRLLVSVPGITQISRYDYDRWGHYWSFTDMSLRKLLEQAAPDARVEVKTYGNVKAAACFLYGLAAHEVSTDDLDRHDPDYQVTIAAVLEKP